MGKEPVVVEPPRSEQMTEQYNERELQCIIIQKDNDMKQIADQRDQLSSKLLKIQAEHEELKKNVDQIYQKETTIKELRVSVENSEKEKGKIVENMKIKERQSIEEKQVLTKNYEAEILRLKTTLENLNSKGDSVQVMENMIDAQKDKIDKLEKEKNQYVIEFDEKTSKREIKMQIKFEDLKKKMLENLQDTKKNVKDLNLDTLEISTKLTILQNHQLNVELEYQAEVINDLMKRNEQLNKKIFEMKRDLEIHAEVENKLAEKNRTMTKTIKTMTITENSNRSNIVDTSSHFDQKSSAGGSMIIHTCPNNNSNLNSGNETYGENNQIGKTNIRLNDRLKEFQIISSLEKKISKLEKTLERKQDDYITLKGSFTRISDKLEKYDKKYSNIFNLFEESIEKLSQDETLQNMNHIYLNVEVVKNCDFAHLTSDQKYSVLVMLMKYLIPLINPQDLQNSEFNKNNFDKIKLKYHYKKNKKSIGLRSGDNSMISGGGYRGGNNNSDLMNEMKTKIMNRDSLDLLPRLNTNY